MKKGKCLDGGENGDGVGGGRRGREYDHPINQRCLFQKCTQNRMKTRVVLNGVYFTPNFTTPGLNTLLQLVSVLPLPLLQY